MALEALNNKGVKVGGEISIKDYVDTYLGIDNGKTNIEQARATSPKQMGHNHHTDDLNKAKSDHQEGMKR